MNCSVSLRFVAMGMMTLAACAALPSSCSQQATASAQASPAQEMLGQPNSKRVAIRNFDIDATEVSVGQMRRFTQSQNRVTDAEKSGGGFEFVGGWQWRPNWTFLTPYGTPAQDNEPAVHVSWFEARDYCAWAGGRLPTAAEWRLAAYTELRPNPPATFQTNRVYEYPTGTTPGAANVAGEADGFARHAPVERTPAGVNGLYDMGGNVWEWLNNPRGNERLTAGGSWWYGPTQMTASSFQFKAADFYAAYVGFRCVYDQSPTISSDLVR